MSAAQKKVVYISGPITGVEKYWEAFENVEDHLTALGYIALTPSRLPKGLTDEQYMRINMAMIDSADAVIFLLGWEGSKGATLEYNYCKYTKKPHIYQRRRVFAELNPVEEQRAWLYLDLREVLEG